MARRLPFGLLLIGCCLATIGSAMAEDKAPAGAVAAKAAAPITGRRKLEALLQSPARLDFGQRETVTVKELLARLHQQHQLSIRFDVPTLTAMLGGSSSATSQPKTLTASHRDLITPPMLSRVGSGMGLVTISQTTPPNADGNAGTPKAEPASPSNAVTPANATSEVKIDPTKQKVADPDPRLPGAPQAPNETPPTAPEPETAGRNINVILDSLMSAEVDIRTIDLKTVSIATVLRHALDALPNSALSDDGSSGMPLVMTNATLFDYLVENDGLQITTRLKALTYKETRVYSLKGLANMTPEQLATVIRQSVRPWSWRSRIDELGDKLKAGSTAIPSKVLAAAGYAPATSSYGYGCAPATPPSTSAPSSPYPAPAGSAPYSAAAYPRRPVHRPPCPLQPKRKTPTRSTPSKWQCSAGPS